MSIYCFDLDNTLCQTRYEDGHYWYLEATPYPERIKIVNQLYESGNTIIIETCRGCGSGTNWFQETANQLFSWGLRFHTLRTGMKFAADYYIDDKAINAKEFFDNLASDK